MSTPEGKVAKAVGGAGNCTTRTFDANQNVLSQTDATEATWNWQYDASGNVIRAIDPLNNEVRFERNLLGQETAIIDQEGAATHIEARDYGEHARASLGIQHSPGSMGRIQSTEEVVRAF